MKTVKDFFIGVAWGLLLIALVAVIKYCSAASHNDSLIVNTIKYPENIVYVQGVALDTEILNNYCKGWKDGYEDGYCSNQQAGCIKPQVPACPAPKINEDPGYKGGYWRGFKAGDAKWKEEHE